MIRIRISGDTQKEADAVLAELLNLYGYHVTKECDAKRVIKGDSESWVVDMEIDTPSLIQNEVEQFEGILCGHGDGYSLVEHYRKDGAVFANGKLVPCTAGDRWEIIDEPSPTGKIQFQCGDCYRVSTTQDRRCPRPKKKRSSCPACGK